MFRPISSIQPAAINCSKFIRSTNPKITSNCSIASSPMSDRSIKICNAITIYQPHAWCTIWHALVWNGLSVCQYHVHNFIACGRERPGRPVPASICWPNASQCLTQGADSPFILKAVMYEHWDTSLASGGGTVEGAVNSVFISSTRNYIALRVHVFWGGIIGPPLLGNGAVNRSP
jgi:hypothetical protein